MVVLLPGERIEGLMRVLLIEDDLTAARTIVLMLRAAGAVVEHSASGEESVCLT
jgi:DNA-binding response OmpR family regulator